MAKGSFSRNPDIEVAEPHASAAGTGSSRNRPARVIPVAGISLVRALSLGLRFASLLKCWLSPSFVRRCLVDTAEQFQEFGHALENPIR